MKRLNDFKKESVSNLESIQGGFTEKKGKFVSTDFITWFNWSVSDVFYDANDNGIIDNDEGKSLSIATASGQS